ncbi:MAG: hypothetical protein ABII98_01830, partial [bacterium]
MEPTLHLNEFFIEGGDQAKSHVLLHITEPSTEEEKKKGYFFAICETSGADSNFILKLQGIIDEIENEYYDTPEAKGENVLEPIFEKANQQGISLFDENSDFHCIVGAIRAPEIIFSYYNNPQAVLFFRKSDGSYHKMDLVKNNQEEVGEESDHIFSQIIQGKIGSNDYLLISTPHLIEYFNHDRLLKILTTRTTGQSAKHLEKVLNELKNGLSFGGLIVRLEGDFKATSEACSEKAANPGKSVPDLYATAQNTADTLSPSLFNSINSKIKNWQSNLAPNPNTTVTKHGSGTTHKTAIESAHIKPHFPSRRPTSANGSAPQFAATVGKGLWAGVKFILNSLLWLLVVFFNLLKGFLHIFVIFFYLITNFRNQRKPVLDGAKLAWHNFTQTFTHLSRMTKILVVLFLLAAISLVGGISYTNMQKRESSAKLAYDALVKSITTQIDAAESALIYNDNAGSLKELNAARGAMEQLPCESKDEKTVCQNMENRTMEISNKLRKITYARPELIADWSAFETDLKNTVKIGNKILAFGNSSSTIAVYNFLTKQSTDLNSGLAGGFVLGSVPKENDYAVLLYGKQDLYKYNPDDNSIEKIEAGYPMRGADIKGLVVYNRRLYSL